MIILFFISFLLLFSISITSKTSYRVYFRLLLRFLFYFALPPINPPTAAMTAATKPLKWTFSIYFYLRIISKTSPSCCMLRAATKETATLKNYS